MTYTVELVCDKVMSNRKVEVKNFNAAFIEFRKMVEQHWYLYNEVHIRLYTTYFEGDLNVIYSLSKKLYTIPEGELNG